MYRRLAIAGRGYGRWKRIAMRTTGRRGRVAATDTPPMNSQYQWRPGDRRHPLMRRGPVQALTVAPHITVAVRTDGTVTGRVDPTRPGARVEFYASDGGGQDEEGWERVGTATIGRSGAFRHRRLRGGVEYIAVLAPAPDTPPASRRASAERCRSTSCKGRPSLRRRLAPRSYRSTPGTRRRALTSIGRSDAAEMDAALQLLSPSHGCEHRKRAARWPAPDEVQVPGPAAA